MGIFIAFIIAGIIGIFFISVVTSKRKRRLRLIKVDVPDMKDDPFPGLEMVIEDLEAALSSEYTSKIKARVLASHEKWTDHDFDWRMFELKRYFIMGKLLKSVPMFSEEVDEIWHEMLMFTKEYEQFSKRFYGSFLHHTPNTETISLPNERAFFDWVYLQLFRPTPNSRLLWGNFLKHPLERHILKDFQLLSDEQLLIKYFRMSDEMNKLQRMIINLLRSDISSAGEMYEKEIKKPFQRMRSEDNYQFLLTAMVFYSIYEENNFEQEMNQLLPKEAAHAAHTSSSCSSFACSTSYENDSGSDGGGSSSCSGSSCSSCSSCGSS